MLLVLMHHHYRLSRFDAHFMNLPVCPRRQNNGLGALSNAVDHLAYLVLDGQVGFGGCILAT